MMMSRISTYLASAFCFLSTSLLAQDADLPMPPRDQGLWQTVIMVGIAIMFFYFILWRPEQKRRKEMDAKRAALKKGDQVIAATGIVGHVSSISEKTVVLKMVDGSKIEVVKGAVSEILAEGELGESKST